MTSTSSFVDADVTEAARFPAAGVRLDDLAASRALTQLRPRELFSRWPAVFDTAGMVRATRIPLGLAAKMWVEEGDVDLDGVAAGPQERGYYYKWWRGLHCLMGNEGYANGLYRVRPSFERFKCTEFGFKLDSRAVIQAPEGAQSKLHIAAHDWAVTFLFLQNVRPAPLHPAFSPPFSLRLPHSVAPPLVPRL